MQEAEAAVSMLKEWGNISVNEALLMLSGRFGHPAIRERAIHVLQENASDADICDFMSQLVQCIRYDGADDTMLLAGALSLSWACASSGQCTTVTRLRSQ